MRALYKTFPFAQFLRQAQILILEIFNIFLRLKFLSSLTLTKIGHFSRASIRLLWMNSYQYFYFRVKIHTIVDIVLLN